MENNNTNWGQSVTGIVIKDGKVLLARHTYGDGRGLLIVPGGYVEYGEAPQDALRREFFEETNIMVEPKKSLGLGSMHMIGMWLFLQNIYPVMPNRIMMKTMKLCGCE